MRSLKAVGLAGFAVTAAATVAALLVWRAADRALDTPMTLPDDGRVIEIAPGATLRGVAGELTADGALAHPRWLVLYGRLRGLATEIKAGEYRLEPGTTPRAALERFVSGDTLLHEFTIVEGWTAAQALAVLQRDPAVTATIPGDDPQALLAAIEAEESHPEGLLFPETYHFPRGTRDVDILRRAHALMREKLAAAWAERNPALPLERPYEALILASIVEKETGRADERRAIAGVFVRRLEKNMRLQSDPTVIYGLGDSYDGDIRRRDLATDTPYNTYTRRGLPPTPIALPGEASLRAAVQPAEGEALYFVATGLGDGSHEFTATLAEHEAAVARYLRRLREKRAERGGRSDGRDVGRDAADGSPSEAGAPPDAHSGPS